jgi:hypothetical protein
MNALALTLRFVDRINGHDVGGLVALMPDDHQFVDARGEVHQGRTRMEGYSRNLARTGEPHV